MSRDKLMDARAERNRLCASREMSILSHRQKQKPCRNRNRREVEPGRVVPMERCVCDRAWRSYAMWNQTSHVDDKIDSHSDNDHRAIKNRREVERGLTAKILR